MVGHLPHPLLPDAPLKMAAEGSGLADLFNAVQLEVSGAQLSAASLANDVAGLPQVVRRRDLLIAYPYTNTLTVLRITGAVLRQAMERSAAYFTRGEDNTLRVSDCFLEPRWSTTITITMPGYPMPMISLGQSVSGSFLSWSMATRSPIPMNSPSA